MNPPIQMASNDLIIEAGNTAGGGDDTAGGGDNTAGGGNDTVMTLRGAGVVTDVRLVGRIAVGLFLVCLAALVVVLYAGGLNKNAQIARLHREGVPVLVTSTGCTGLLGGSGSNPVGYACRGAFTVAGHRYNESIPGNTLYPPGSTLRALTVPADPALVTPVRLAAAEHTSATVFVVPAVLLVLLIALSGLVLGSRRHHRAP